MSLGTKVQVNSVSLYKITINIYHFLFFPLTIQINLILRLLDFFMIIQNLIKFISREQNITKYIRFQKKNPIYSI